jgi:hypothetical protein
MRNDTLKSFDRKVLLPASLFSQFQATHLREIPIGRKECEIRLYQGS